MKEENVTAPRGYQRGDITFKSRGLLVSRLSVLAIRRTRDRVLQVREGVVELAVFNQHAIGVGQGCACRLSNARWQQITHGYAKGDVDHIVA